jgi:hypothetical protein
LYTVPNLGASTNSLPPALADAFLWQDFWRKVLAYGPVSTARWRITKDERDRIIVTNLADQEKGYAPGDEEQAGFDALPRQLLVQPGDNLVVVHIDEKQLGANS